MQSSSYQRNTGLIPYTYSEGFKRHCITLARSMNFLQQLCDSVVLNLISTLKRAGCFQKTQNPRHYLKLVINRNLKLPAKEKYYCVQHMYFGHGSVIFSYLKKFLFLLYYFHSCIPQDSYAKYIIIILVLTEIKAKKKSDNRAFQLSTGIVFIRMRAFQ